MKNYMQTFWMRIFACLVCSVSIVGLVIATIFAAGFTSLENEEALYKMGIDKIAKNYAAYIYENKDEDLSKKLNSKQTGITYSITKQEADDGTEGALYDNGRNPNGYQYIIPEGGSVNSDISSIWNVLRTSDSISVNQEINETPITGYVFDQNTGLFYYETPEGYFIIEHIMVCDENDEGYYDYNLISGKTYYNGYYDITLDTNAYENWESVQFEGVYIDLTNPKSGNEVLKVVGAGEEIELEVNTNEWFVGAGTICYLTQPSNQYIIDINLNTDYRDTGLFQEWINIYRIIRTVEDYLAEAFLIFGIVFLCSLILLGYSAIEDKEKIKFMHKIPVIIYTVVMFTIGGVLCACFAMTLSRGFGSASLLPKDFLIVGSLALLESMSLTAVLWLQNIITRVKTKTFWRYSELYYLIKPVKTLWNFAQENVSFFWKAILLIAINFLLEMVLVVGVRNSGDMMVVWLLIKMVQLALVIMVVMQLYRLREGGKRIAAGELKNPVDTEKMFWEFKAHGEDMNCARNAIQVAVDEQMKSERFKTELITNVSHDIKTPLTSIINYVDLIKKEDIKDETLNEYVEVLDRQSARLKKLIEDLMEASKASTGNLNVELEECNVEVLLTQVLGEYEEKLAANDLQIVVNKPEEPVVTMADGRHIWRVFDNLLNNACKYSLPGTRVYIALTKENGLGLVTFRNISKEPLNIDSDELMERFVRGDSSRNTEGSGLGLSIAQSLTELMGGTMKLEIDGDLFKVTLAFKMK